MNWLERCDITVVNGDLFNQQVEALVIPVESSLTFTHVLGRELLSRYGQTLRVAASQVARNAFGDHIPLGDGFATPIEGVKGTRWVILVAWWDKDNRYTQGLIEQCVSTALRKAFETQSTSIALPLFGVNSPDLNLEHLYAAVPNVPREFDSLRTSITFAAGLEDPFLLPAKLRE